MAKITIVGAGNVGATTTRVCAEKQLGEIVLIDIIEGVPQGKALDLMESAPLQYYDINIKGTNDYKDTEGSDVVVLTAGLARKPGMSREDLRDKNADIIKMVTENVIAGSPNCIMIVVSNPVDTMTFVAKKYSNLPKERIMGMAGLLDSTRFRHFISAELDVSHEDVDAMVLGLHGDDMVPLPRYATVSGISITELISADKIDAMVERTKKGGGEIVALLKTGSAYYAPGASVGVMVESIVRDSKRVVSCPAWLEGEYGLKDIFMGVPCVLGKNGIERILELKLTDEEQAHMNKSAEGVKKSIAELKV